MCHTGAGNDTGNMTALVFSVSIGKFTIEIEG
jgi:hypothetical protein